MVCSSQYSGGEGKKIVNVRPVWAPCSSKSDELYCETNNNKEEY